MNKEQIKKQEAVIKSGRGFLIHRFAKKTEGADIDKLQTAVIESKDEREMTMFAIEVGGVPISNC